MNQSTTSRTTVNTVSILSHSVVVLSEPIVVHICGDELQVVRVVKHSPRVRQSFPSVKR